MQTFGSYTWNITDYALIKQIKTATNGQRFLSDIFSVANLDWQIDIRPNGANKDRIGSCNALLRLVTMPTEWKSILIQFTIYSPQTHSKCTTMELYTKDKKSYGWPSYSLSFDELKSIASRHLIFITNIKIIRIKLNKNNKIYFQNKFKYSKQIKLKWNINKNILKTFKNAKYGKQYESDVYHGMWSIELYPNGNKKKYDGKCQVAVRLCNLPANVSKIVSKYKISLTPLNKTITRNEFEYYVGHNYGYLETLITYASLLSASRLTISVKISILREYDNNNNLVFDKATATTNDNDDQKNDLNVVLFQNNPKPSNYKVIKHSNSKKKPKYDFKVLMKKERVIDVKENSLNIKIPIGAIANTIATSVATYASGGALAPLLVNQIKDMVINISWSSSTKNEKSVDHFFVGDTYLFLEIIRSVKIKKTMFTKSITISGKYKFFYIEAGNDIAKVKLKQLAQEQAADAFAYIQKDVKTWS